MTGAVVKGGVHERDRQHTVVHLRGVLAGRELVPGRPCVVHHHRGHPRGHAVLQDGGARVLPVRQGSRIRRGAGSAILNVLWFVFGGVFLALEALLNGVLLCITVIGIPFGLQCFKQAKLALLPFGAVVRGK